MSKGVDCIADAASKLLTLHPDLQLIVVGEYCYLYTGIDGYDYLYSV